MRTLIPQEAGARAKPMGRAGRGLGFGLTPLALALFGLGLVICLPAFFAARQIYWMLGWDGLMALLVVVDGARLPAPERFVVRRRFLDSPQMGRATRVELAVRLDGDAAVEVRLVDDLHPALVAMPEEQVVQVRPGEDAVSVTTIYPGQRGDFEMGRVYLRYRGGLRMVERWAAAELRVGLEPSAEQGWALEAGAGSGPEAGAEQGKDDAAARQVVRVYPAHEDGRRSTEFYLLRARQIEMERRRLQLRGMGREFECLREYQPGDELRKISWTATARRGRLVTRQFTVERSQQVWMLLEAGRLSRTAFELRRRAEWTSGQGGGGFEAETFGEREAAHLLTVTQLDQAASAVTMLAQVIQGGGDKFAMLAYGRRVQQLLPPGRGAAHLRMLMDLLSQTRSETAEANHLQAVARLKTAQRRRGLILWITELADSAGRPELVTAAGELARRHVVVLILLRHPALEALAAQEPRTREEMFHSAAAQEMLERRKERLAELERQGVLILETTAEEMGARAVSAYLEVKAQGRV
ncbi:MAG: DUF58 domain-containing protein [Acidobacteriaceae bacterium]